METFGFSVEQTVGPPLAAQFTFHERFGMVARRWKAVNCSYRGSVFEVQLTYSVPSGEC
jgi:hypothetical protein